MPNPTPSVQASWLERLIRSQLSSALPAMLLLFSLVLGAAALMLTPREEEPQIVVPMANLHIQAPGLSPKQVERQITQRLEALLDQVSGVEHIYSQSSKDKAMLTVRFKVGEDTEASLLKLYTKLYSNTDKIPAAVRAWQVKPVAVDDVPILVMGLYSDDEKYSDAYSLRRLAEELSAELISVDSTNAITVQGGLSRQIGVELKPQAMAARGVSATRIVEAIAAANAQAPIGHIFAFAGAQNERLMLEAGAHLQSVAELKALVIQSVDGKPVYLQDVAAVIDTHSEVDNYSWLDFGPAHPQQAALSDASLVSIAVAKKAGSNAVSVSADIQQQMQHLAAELLPPQVHMELLRDYGETANAKVNDLTNSLLIAMLTVVIFIGLFLGWRPALVVGLAIPITYGAALAVNYFAGYTINRVTLFALILALGLLVDDPITGVDNIERHMRKNPKRGVIDNIVAAISEIRMALVMSTVAIILAFVPMAFITGMMGPYMAPMAFNVPVAVIISTLVAFFITPWLSKLFLSKGANEATSADEVKPSKPLTPNLYQRLLAPLLQTRKRAWAAMIVVIGLFIITAMLPVLRVVPLKLLPFDNKSELQVVIDLDDNATLEETRALSREVMQIAKRLPEVEALAAYVGTASPMDFNGLVRHYYLRQNANMADIRILLAPKEQRSAQSHAVLLRLRSLLAEIAQRPGVRLKLVEPPPGPPVIATLAVELYGSALTPYDELQTAGLSLMQRMAEEPLLVDLDSSVRPPRESLQFVPDQAKAALSGVSNEELTRTLLIANQGEIASYLEQEDELNPLPIKVRLPQEHRSSVADLGTVQVQGLQSPVSERQQSLLKAAARPLVPLAELGEFVSTQTDSTIFRKDMRRVVYVFAESAGRPPADIVADMVADQDATEDRNISLEDRSFLSNGGGKAWSLPDGIEAIWTGEGEWNITVKVFRDMGIAFAFALTGIFIVLRLQTGSVTLALIIMSSIPLTVIGIMPGFALMNGLGERSVAGFPDPVLFTATAMIGMIALAGIVVRNSLIMVEFIRQEEAQGKVLIDALLSAGAKRMRPILLTAGTTLLGNIVITLDPVFSGLALSIMFGIIASTAFTLVVIPIIYYLVYSRDTARGDAQ